MDEAKPGSVAQALENAEIEAAIEACVRNFYAKGRNDDLLGPVFNSTVADWERHLKRIQDFWSRTLLGTARYSGHPYPAHMHLPVEPEHFLAVGRAVRGDSARDAGRRSGGKGDRARAAHEREFSGRHLPFQG